MNRLFFLFAVLGIGTLCGAEEQKYFRLTDDSLDTAVVTYKNKTGQTVDLIGAIHIADKAYYDRLNERFKSYDALLYEMVAPKNARPIKGRSGMDIHKVSATILGLETQMANVDYSPKNFVHADCSFDDLKKAGKARGESALTFTLGAITDMIRAGNAAQEKVVAADEQISLLDLLGSDKSKMKQIFAKQMLSSDSALGPTIGYYIVDVRNEAAMKVVVEQLKSKNKLGLFYGAAHLPDFHKRLTALGFEPIDTQWEVAWKIK